MILPMMFSASRLAPWQAMYAYAGTYSLIVPEGCTSIAGVAIAPGGGGACGASGDTNSSPAGGGGALSYSNAIPVTPGEVLTIVMPAVGGAGGTMSNGGNAADAAATPRLAKMSKALAASSSKRLPHSGTGDGSCFWR